MYDTTPSPTPTIEDGARVLLRRDPGLRNFLRPHMRLGTVTGYATPDLKQNQVWSRESYYVTLDIDRTNTKRVFSRDILEVL